MPFLVDGNNLLWAILGNDERFAPVTDVELCGLLSRYFWYLRDDGEVVFDGTGPVNKAPFRQLDSLDVTFAGRDVEADAIIESRITVCTNPKQLVVVSTDRRIRSAARSRRALSCRADDFWEKVTVFQRRRPQRREPLSKQHGLSTNETDQWLKTFGLDDE